MIAYNHGCPYLEALEGRKDPPSEPPERGSLAHTLISGFWSPDWERVVPTICSPVVCCPWLKAQSTVGREVITLLYPLYTLQAATTSTY